MKRNNGSISHSSISKMADAYRKIGWVLIMAGSIFGVTSDEKHLVRGILMWGTCQIAAYLMDELDRSAFGSARK